MMCELALRKHFVSLACQVGRQSLWQVPCPMSASTLEWEITRKESHVLLFVKHFKTGHLHLSSSVGMEFCRILSEHLVPTHSHPLGQGLFPTEPLTTSGCVNFAFPISTGAFCLVSPCRTTKPLSNDLISELTQATLRGGKQTPYKGLWLCLLNFTQPTKTVKQPDLTQHADQ